MALIHWSASGLAFRRGMPPNADYTFKHALVRDAAYQHAAAQPTPGIARAYRKGARRRLSGDPSIRRPELLAHHFTHAGFTRSCDRLLAPRRTAQRRPIRSFRGGAHFRSALDLLEKLPPSEQRNAQELDLTLNLAVPLIAVHGFGALRVEECALSAKELSDGLQASPSRFTARRLAWNSCLMRQPVPRTVALARGPRELADRMNPAKLAVAHRSLGYSLLIAGEFGEADEMLARGVALADSIRGSRIRRLRRASEHGLPSLWRAGENHGRLSDIRSAARRRGGCSMRDAETMCTALPGRWAVAAHVFQIHNEAAAAAPLRLGGY